MSSLLRPHPLCRPADPGFALVSTILIVAVLAIMVVAFLQSMRIDQMTARSYLNKTSADAIVELGGTYALEQLVGLVEENPFHATGYEEVGGQVVPIFEGAANPLTQPTRSYLLSTPSPATPPNSLTNANSVDLNRLERKPGGWIGSRATPAGLPSTPDPKRAMWLNVLADEHLPEQPDPSQLGYNPVVGRFAFWIEDETAKLDIGIIGNNVGPGGAFQRDPDDSQPAQLDLGALPLLDFLPLPNNDQGRAINQAILSRRTGAISDKMDLGFIPEWMRQGVPALPPDRLRNALDAIGFYATTFSLANQLSSSGRRRVNINHLVTNVTPSDSNPGNRIKSDLDDIIFAITGRHLIPNPSDRQGFFKDLPEAAPEEGYLRDFGRRFYFRPNMPSGPFANLRNDHQMVYLIKLAANIRDYIDADNLPTVVDRSGNVIYGSRPNFAFRSGEEPIAFGKEAGPRLQETAIRFKFLRCDILDSGSPHRRLIDFEVDYYFEFYNPATKDFVAPANTELKVYNLPIFSAGGFPSVRLRDYTLNLSGVVFPAGRATVVTTTPSGGDPVGLIPESLESRVVRLTPIGGRSVLAHTSVTANAAVGSGTSARNGLRLDGRSSADADYSSELVLTTPTGYLEAFAFFSIPGSTTAPVELTLRSDSTQGTWIVAPVANRDRRLTWVSSLRGNDAPSRTGDPQSLNESMEFNAGSNAAFGNEQSRFFSSHAGAAAAISPNATLARAQIPFVVPANWPDYSLPLDDTANSAYAVFRDGPMRSIGELGLIYDPHRRLNPANDGTSIPDENVRIRRARGGGRTLKIGQRDDLVVSRFSSPSDSGVGWFHSAWRLTDIFSAEDPETSLSAPTARGKLNINGVLRDEGLALKSLLRSFNFLDAPQGDPGRANRPLTDSEIDNLVNSVLRFLRTQGPFLERGELSEIDFFAGAGAVNRAGGQAGSISMDRSREEIFRRLVEHITTRSASFTLYVVGEAIRQRPNGSLQRLASSKRKIVFHLLPEIGDQPGDRPDSYRVNIHEQSL